LETATPIFRHSLISEGDFMDEIKIPEEGSTTKTQNPWGYLLSEEWTEAWKQFEERVRQRPGSHLLMALAIGYLLQIIPFRRLFVLAVKLCLRLAGPALFLFCAFNLFKFISEGAPKNKVDVTVTSEQIQQRAYQIAERRKSLGVSGDETEDWAQAERELRAEATGK
jgi:hypothetical protein